MRLSLAPDEIEFSAFSMKNSGICGENNFGDIHDLLDFLKIANNAEINRVLLILIPKFY